MLDTAAVNQLAESIKEAFAQSLPSDLPPAVREPILENYNTMSSAIASAISTFIKKAQISVPLTRDTMKGAMQRYMTNDVRLNITNGQGFTVMANGLPARTDLTNEDIGRMFGSNNNPVTPEVIRGSIQ